MKSFYDKISLSAVIMFCVFCLDVWADADRFYARGLLERAGVDDVGFRVAGGLGHEEAFRVIKDGNNIVVEHQGSAGAVYGAQAVIDGEYEPGKIEKPDFDIRGTTLCLMPHRYTATLSPKLYPWFYDKGFMTRTLDSFAEARLNTIFLWAGHMFPYIVEMPEYPEAAGDIPAEQVKANQEQFRWFTNECEKRNIKVLLHFYNIHVSPPFAKKHKMRTNPTTPTPLLRKYTHYALSRYFKEFASVGLYACPGESINSKYQLEWFRDVIFDAAKKSGKNPLIVIRDWTQNMEFRDNIKNLYENAYTEQKHNDESLTSPCPDVRIMQMEGIGAGHIVNFHLVTDLVPMRWGSPVLLQESMGHLKRLGFVKGVEFFGQTFWKWPYTLDKLEPYQKGYIPKGPKLVSLDRDAIYFKAFGRYLWRADRDGKKEREYWTGFLAKKFGSRKVGELVYQWYVTSGPISPGLQNLNATKVAGWWPAVMLHNQRVDQIREYNISLEQTPYTLYRETGRAQQRYYPRPFDEYFFERYRKAYGLPKRRRLPAMYKEFGPYKKRLGIDGLEQRHCMPVSQYARALEKGLPVDFAMVPDKTVDLLNALAKESFDIAGKAVKEAKDSGAGDENVKELERFVTDSEMYVLATQTMIYKEKAAILKARMPAKAEGKLEAEFLKNMELSVASYKKLAELTAKTYLHGNDLMGSHWTGSGIREFEKDLATQHEWLKKFKQHNAAAGQRETLTIGLIGDSTVASTYGWGPAFATRFGDKTKVLNFARNGATLDSLSGRLDGLLKLKPDYVFIQFGHNDQKRYGSKVYSTKLKSYVNRIKAAGGNAVIMSSVTRRYFDKNGKIRPRSGGTLKGDLPSFAKAAQAIAIELKVPFIDLNKASIEHHNKIGRAESMTYNARERDWTHFSKKGAEAITDLIVKELKTAVPEAAAYLK